MEVDPTTSPRYLGGEEIDDSPEREAQAAQISHLLGLIREDEQMYDSPAWKRFVAFVDSEFKQAVEQLVSDTPHDPQTDAVKRGKAIVYQWLLALPREARTERTRLSDQYRALEAPPEEGSEA